MKAFQSILVVIPSRSPQSAVHQLAWNSMHLAQWIKCEAHFLVDITETPTLQAAITEFKHSQTPAPSTLIIHPNHGNLADRVLETVQKYSCGLILLKDGVVLHPTKGIDERRLLELSPRPVLLLPKDFDFEKYPPQGFLAPLSGENRISEALTVSLRLAHQTSSSVDFLHIMNPGEPCDCGQTLETLGDQLHHEYSYLLDHVASEASPYSTIEERHHLRHFFHCTGFAIGEVTKILGRSPGAILVLEWKGSLASGHANTVKGILQQTGSPILFVKTVRERQSTLRVGKNLKAA